MKKIIFMLFGFFLLVNPVNAIEKPDVKSGEKVTVYMFRGKTCSYCKDAVEYFHNLGKEYDKYFDVITFEVYEDQGNRVLFQLAQEYLEVDPETVGVPFFVIGETVFQGFGQGSGEAIIAKALEEFVNKDYKDFIVDLKKDVPTDFSVNEDTLKTAATSYGLEENKAKTSESSGYITLIIFLALIGGSGYLFYRSTTNN